ncbi:MAG: hypothetical protein V8T10_01000 [Merdibacter sp.]
MRKNNPLEQEIRKIVKKKKTKVKPNYRNKQKQEVERLRRKARQEMIQEDIRRQQKERAKGRCGRRERRKDDDHRIPCFDVRPGLSAGRDVRRPSAITNA